MKFKFYNLHKYFKMRCPMCLSVLEPGEERRFENSLDHAFDPNGTYERPLRPTWVCPHCRLGDVSYHDEMGDWYVKNHEELRKFVQYKDMHKYHFAIFSWSWFQKIDNWFWWKNLKIRDWYNTTFKKEPSIFYKEKKK